MFASWEDRHVSRAEFCRLIPGVRFDRRSSLYLEQHKGIQGVAGDPVGGAGVPDAGHTEVGENDFVGDETDLGFVIAALDHISVGKPAQRLRTAKGVFVSWRLSGHGLSFLVDVW
ncbi:hypothetical protein C5E08_12660 [Rathayibacter iranicus]|uniref:Uncharacterized protein n=1 Tax=Rathayibacter iranicus TaxID=59737 RepID=A0AAD1AEC3_9MICO|nr:hypothetical protein C7V51_12825 [Rathayibacter iranicus]PPI43304.1 hypothetical protein C5E09_11745 [Rathayibacter iranicus]PPI58247.1 hypothetical protein C5E08_12660 [Rathayibacter iranicus]PPI69460.1 hypothetical protein C5E01_11705 [Rathayibacter iranicus]